MYFEDFTNYSFLYYENTKNIGWLDKACSYPKGKVSEEFIDKLWEYVRLNINRIRGVRNCSLCTAPYNCTCGANYKGELIMLGYSEIRVFSKDGKNIKNIIIAQRREGEDYIEITEVFHSNIVQGNLDRIIKLINSSLEKITKIIDLSEWLYIAASEGKLEIVKYLISYGVKMDISKPRSNPLFGAIYQGNVDVAKLLIENGIDINIKYSNEFMRNKDAIALAEEMGQAEIVRALKARI